MLLGFGMLNWSRYERIGDRYGAVMLLREYPADRVPSMDDYIETEPKHAYAADFADAPVGAKGKLVATVVRTRQSGHIGDLFRGLIPPDHGEGASVGERVELGEGTLFTEFKDGYPYVGLKPDDGRTTDWLDPEKLYYLHEQTVELSFEPLS